MLQIEITILYRNMIPIYIKCFCPLFFRVGSIGSIGSTDSVLCQAASDPLLNRWTGVVNCFIVQKQ